MDKNNFGLEFKFIHKDKNDNVLYDSGWEPNQVSDDGFEAMFDVFFRDGNAPEKFQVGLATSSPSKDDSLDDLYEVSGSGYERQDVLRDSSDDGFSLGLSDGDMEISSKMVQFENLGTESWDTATNGFLTAVMSGTDIFVCWRQLNVNRTLYPGDKLNIQVKQKGKVTA